MVIIKEKVIKNAVVFNGAGFSFRLSETTFDKWTKMYEKNPKKAESQVQLAVQKGLKVRFPNESLTGQNWEEDLQDICAEVTGVVKNAVGYTQTTFNDIVDEEEEEIKEDLVEEMEEELTEEGAELKKGELGEETENEN